MAKQKATVTAKTSNFGANRIKRITRHLKKHPNDQQAQSELRSGKTVSTRKAPNNKMGWLSSDKNVELVLRSKFVGGVTKENLVKHAQILRFTKKAPFHQIPVIAYQDDKPVYVFKHTSKLSNFKKVVEQKAA